MSPSLWKHLVTYKPGREGDEREGGWGGGRVRREGGRGTREREGEEGG